MKKDFIFSTVLLIVGILLSILKVTGMTVHIAISVIGVAVLIAYTGITRKKWKIPALEIGMRACYGIALITGIILKVAYIGVLGSVHKISAIVFVIALVILFVQKILVKTKK